MTRKARLKAAARKLHALGSTYSAIGLKLGIDRETARKYCEMPEDDSSISPVVAPVENSRENPQNRQQNPHQNPQFPQQNLAPILQSPDQISPPTASELDADIARRNVDGADGDELIRQGFQPERVEKVLSTVSKIRSRSGGPSRDMKAELDDLRARFEDLFKLVHDGLNPNWRLHQRVTSIEGFLRPRCSCGGFLFVDRTCGSCRYARGARLPE